MTMIRMPADIMESGPRAEDRGYHDARRAHAGCMICGDRDHNPHSLALAFERHADGSVSALCDAGRRFQGYDGILHGGMISALLDAVMTHCLFAHGVRAVTADMTIRFVAPVATDRAFLLTAWPASRKRRTHWVEARLTRDARLLARATARFIEPRPPSPVA